jgi:hypothetical protein
MIILLSKLCVDNIFRVLYNGAGLLVCGVSTPATLKIELIARQHIHIKPFNAYINCFRKNYAPGEL